MSSESTNTGESRSPRHLYKIGRGPLVALVILAALAGGSLLVIRLSSPTQTNLDTVSQLIGSNQVSHLDLAGSTLTVTKTGGEQLQVASVTLDEFQPLEAAAATASVPVTASSTAHTALSDMAFLATMALPVLVLLVLVILVVRLARRPPRVGFAG